MTDKGYCGPARSNGQAHENGAANGRDASAPLMILDGTPVPAGERPADEAHAEKPPAAGNGKVESGSETVGGGQAAAAESHESILDAREADDIADRRETGETGAADEPQAADAVEEEAVEEPAQAAPLFTDEDRWRHLRMGEALLFASAEPLSTKQIAERLPDGADVERVLADLSETYANRGVNLMRVAGGWAFRTATDLSFLMERERVEQRKLSRAALETLAIIAYHQPVTRAEIEDVRGVSVSKGTLDVLMEVGWVRVRGRRQTPGRPVTYGTSDVFLEHFGLDRVSDLPGIDELKAAGLLDNRMPTNMSIPTPSDTEDTDEQDEGEEFALTGPFEDEDSAESESGESDADAEYEFSGTGLEPGVSGFDEEENPSVDDPVADHDDTPEPARSRAAADETGFDQDLAPDEERFEIDVSTESDGEAGKTESRPIERESGWTTSDERSAGAVDASTSRDSGT